VLLAVLPILPIHVHVQGTLLPAERREVRAATPGFVEEIRAVEGEEVTATDPLATLVDPDLEARLASIGWDREVSRSRWAAAEAAGDPAGAAVARASWERLGADREALARRERGLVLRAPIDGRIVAPRLRDRMATYIAAGDLWCEVVSVGSLRVVVDVQESFLADIREGAKAEVAHDGYPGEIFAGRVIRVREQGHRREAPMTADLAGGDAPSTYGVEIEVMSGGGRLRPGMLVNVRIEGPRMSLGGRALRALARLLHGRIWW